MKHTEDIGNMVNSLLSPLSYMFTYDEIVETLEALKDNVQDSPIHVFKTSLDEFLFCQLIFLFGDYGINPQHGWIFDVFKKDILKAITDYMNEEKRCHELEELEDES